MDDSTRMLSGPLPPEGKVKIEVQGGYIQTAPKNRKQRLASKKAHRAPKLRRF